MIDPPSQVFGWHGNKIDTVPFIRELGGDAHLGLRN